MPSIETDDGTELFYTDVGEGPPLLFIHGGFMSHRVWDRQINDLADHYRIIAVDLRGHGQSDKPYMTYSQRVYSRDLHEIIEATGIEDITLVGWSLGATVAMAYMDSFGDRIDRLVLLSTGIFAGVAASGQTRLDFDALFEHHRTDRPDAMMEFVTGLFADPPSDNDARWLWSIGMECPMHVGLEVLRLYAEMDYVAAEDVLSSITVPTAVFQGAHDGAATPADAEYVTEEVLQESTCVKFLQSGHLPFLEESDRFNQVLTKFVQTNS